MSVDPQEGKMLRIFLSLCVIRSICEAKSFTLAVARQQILRSWFRASSMIILNKNQPDAH
jgi:hypothetical protein